MRATQSAAKSGFWSVNCRVISDNMYPGAMALTRMPTGAHSTASDFASWVTAALDALYDAWCCGVLTTEPDIDDTRIALPGIPAVISRLPKACAEKNTPSRLPDMTLRHGTADTSILSFQIVIPAAVSSICAVPRAAAAPANPSATDFSSVTSMCAAKVRTPYSDASRAADDPTSGRMSNSATAHPC